MSLQQEIGGGEICPLLPNGSCDVIPGTSNFGSCDVSTSNNVDFFPRDFDVLQVNTANLRLSPILCSNYRRPGITGGDCFAIFCYEIPCGGALRWFRKLPPDA